METKSPWTARIALVISAACIAAILAIGGSASFAGIPFAVQTSGSPSPTQTPCRFSPAPPPLCPAQSASGSSSPSPSPSETSTEDETHDSTVTIAESRRGFKGRVQSADKCEPKRQVVVRKVRKGPDRLIGRDTTNDTGAWSLAAQKRPGRYYAKVLPRTFNEDDIQVTCKGDRSETIRVR